MGFFPEAATPIVYVWLAAAFALMITVFHHRRLAAARPDDRAYLLYFFLFFAMFLAVPAVLILLASDEPFRALAAAGMTSGNVRRGSALVCIGAPLAVFAAFVGSHDPVMRAQYPFSKLVCASARKLAIYETAYIFLYYLPWEFLFRGLLFFPLVPAIGLVPALAVQTALSTIYHFGHPDTEIFAALGAGFLFGWIAYATGSFLYPAVLHALVGVSTDVFLYRRWHHGVK
jgi:membrane protease YdiL (CAAX protease family)